MSAEDIGFMLLKLVATIAPQLIAALKDVSHPDNARVIQIMDHNPLDDVK